MPDTTERRETGSDSGRGRRLAWFVGLYVVSLLVFGGVVYGLRGLIFLGSGG